MVLLCDSETPLKVNGQRVKHYLCNVDEVKVGDYLSLSEFWVAEATELCHNIVLGVAWKVTQELVGEFWVTYINVLWREHSLI